MTVTDFVPDLDNAELLRIGRLGPDTEEGFLAAVDFGKRLAKDYRKVAFLLGDLGLMMAPELVAGPVDPNTTKGRDRARLHRLAEAIEVEIGWIRTTRTVAKKVPPAHRKSGVAFATYQALVSAETVEGLPPVDWVDMFVSTRGRVPRLRDANDALGRTRRHTVATAVTADEATQKEIVTTILSDSPAVRDAAIEVLTTEVVKKALKPTTKPSLDRQPGSSATLALSPEVTAIERCLSATITALVAARDNVATIAASSSCDHIAMLAGHTAREAQALADVLSLDPSKA